MQAQQHIARVNDLEASDFSSVFYISETPFLFCPTPCDECPDCENSFFQNLEQRINPWCYVRRTGDGEAKATIQSYISGVNEDRAFLNRQCEIHGDRILSRWKKKTQSKRAEILHQADPEIRKEQWYILSSSYTAPDTRKQYRKIWLLPYLTIEALQKNPSILFSLIYNRTRHPPQDFVAADSNELTLGWASGALDVDFNAACVVMHGPKFGQITSWEKNQMHRGDLLGYPRARLVLEAQATLMRFLRRTVELLLTTSSAEELPSCKKWMELARQGFKKGGELERWSQYVYRPFSAPPQLDLEKLKSQARARLDAAADHLWLLQTEPSYLRHYIQSSCPIDLFKTYSTVDPNRVMLMEICSDINTHLFWQWVCEELENAHKLSSQCLGSIQPGKPLPQAYDEVLSMLELLLVNQMHRQSLHIQGVIPIRPGFRHLYDYQKGGYGFAIKYTWNVKLNCWKTFKEEPIFWCIWQLQGAPDEQKRYSYSMLFSYLDDLLASVSTEERSKLDEILYSRLSELAATHEMLSSIRLSRPQNTSGNLDELTSKESRRATNYVKTDLKDISQNSDLVKRLGDFYESPTPNGKKDGTWLQAYDLEHAKLQRFWRGVHHHYSQHLKDVKLSPERITADLKVVQCWNHSEYRERLQARRDDVLAQANKARDTAGNDVFLPLPHSIGQVEKFKTKEPKSKSKTRGKNSAIALEDLHIEGDSVPDDTAVETISVNKRTLATFRAMFPLTLEERTKTIDWETLVLSMEDVGFTATNAGGSAVLFEKSSGIGRHGKIIIHKPHPVAKLGPVMLHSMGWRMNRRFGWDRDLFVLQKK